MRCVYNVQQSFRSIACTELLISSNAFPGSSVGKECPCNAGHLYDLNQISYNYTVEVTNRFKGLDLIDRLPEELWMEVHDIVQEAGIKTMLKEKNCKMVKCLSDEALQIAVNRGKVKGKRERKDITI